MQGDDQMAELAVRTKVVPATLVFQEEAAFKSLLLEKVGEARGRLQKSSA
jgi:hypothetical protein